MTGFRSAPPPPPVELAVVDLAGTTVSDDGVVASAFARAVERTGPAPGGDPTATVAAAMGRSKLEVFTELYRGDRRRAAAANTAFEAAYAEAVAAGSVVARPGAADALDRLRSAGVKVCLATGFAPATRDAVLDALGWRPRADLVLSPADAGRGRPWPDMVLTAVLRLEVGDVRAVAVAGDTVHDLWSGWRAGAGVVAGVLGGAHDAEALSAAPHTHLLASVAELPAAVGIGADR